MTETAPTPNQTTAVQTCPQCGAAVPRQVVKTVRGQPNEHVYACPACGHSWDSLPLGSRHAERPKEETV